MCSRAQNTSEHQESTKLPRTPYSGSPFGEGRLAEVQLPKALRRHDPRTPCRPSLKGDRGDRVCTASSSLGPSHLYSPDTVFRDEDLEAHRRVFCTMNS